MKVPTREVAVSEKVRVKPHERTVKGKTVTVEGYERIKAESDKKKDRHPATIANVTEEGTEGARVVRREDPSRAFPAEARKGVQVLGKPHHTGGVERVSR